MEAREERGLGFGSTAAGLAGETGLTALIAAEAEADADLPLATAEAEAASGLAAALEPAQFLADSRPRPEA